MWTFERRSSSEKELLEVLTDLNHIWSQQDKILEIYGVDKKSGGKQITWEHRFTSWEYSDILKNSEGDPLDIIIHSNGDLIVWEPYVEYVIKKENLAETEVEKIELFYIDGTHSHLGSYKKGMQTATNSVGYVLAVKIN